MIQVLIGSSVLKYWFDDYPRKPKDRDYAVDEKVKSGVKGFEYLYNPLFVEYVLDNTCDMIPTPNMLFTLKCSHIFWDIQYNKHIYDIQWLRSKGCEVIKPLFYDLYGFWTEYHGKNKRSNLNMSAKDFFNNAIKCDIPHDTLHTYLKNPPTYTKVLCNGEEVLVCEDKFNNLSYEDKCNLVTEEVMIMAYERRGNLPYWKAYHLMFDKFLQNHAPLWEAIFILENYTELSKPKFNYYDRIESNQRSFERS